MGSGLRFYNVPGLDAVELRLKSNEVRRLGTDDPQGLAEALREGQRRLNGYVAPDARRRHCSFSIRVDRLIWMFEQPRIECSVSFTELNSALLIHGLSVIRRIHESWIG
jgi:hypothetical protein